MEQIHPDGIQFISLLLWRRVSGVIKPYMVRSDDAASGQLTWGPWRLPEPFGTLNNMFSIIYSVFLLFWSFWPQRTPTTPEGFNWSVVSFSGVVILSILWYMVSAKSYFRGPVKEV
ncbi:hypothetical protein F4680DRAFT_239233 [Xylaria scruposa]|nr:hypothetical protein F4680DRAFT_239233 [Xylaria scruposa]